MKYLLTSALVIMMIAGAHISNVSADISVDTDGDGVTDLQDRCPVSISDEDITPKQSNINRFAYIPNPQISGKLFTRVAGQFSHADYSVSGEKGAANTYGCGCRDILTATGLDRMQNHPLAPWNKGCSASIMNYWIKINS